MGMRFGVVYPQIELSPEPGVLRAYVEEVVSLGFLHLLVYDHVLGADPAVHPGWQGPYDIDCSFHEPFTLFGYLAAVTSLELVTGIVILPQRQTALVAKQAAEVDVLSEGRLRLGVGIGWNHVEYESLGQDFTTRGAREEEQIGLLRRLFTERSVTHEGRFDTVRGAGLNPLPVQKPIPIWMGGQSDAAYRRIGRLADGWFPQVSPGPALDRARALMSESAELAGRDPARLGMEGRVTIAPGETSSFIEAVSAWREAGATHLSVNTMGHGRRSLDEHLSALRAAAEVLGLPLSR